MNDVPRDRNILAAEYVIGLLTPEETYAVETQASTDPELAASIRSWQRRLMPLADGVVPQDTPPEVWQRLEAAISPPIPAVSHKRQWKRQRAAKVWANVNVWRGVSFASFIAGMAVMGLIVTPKMLMSPPAVGALVPVGTKMPTFLVMVMKNGEATMIADASELQPGNVLELWGVPPGGTVPVSLGVVPAKGRFKMPAIVPAETNLLISSEPEGGSPTGAPTGAVLYSGKLVKG